MSSDLRGGSGEVFLAATNQVTDISHVPSVSHAFGYVIGHESNGRNAAI